MTLTLAQYAAHYRDIERSVASAVFMPKADGSQLVLYDPDPAAVTAGQRDQLGSWDITQTPAVPRACAMLRLYAGALAVQLVGAARVSMEAQVAAAAPEAPAFQSQNVAASLASVKTTHVGTDLATRSYTVLDPFVHDGAAAGMDAVLEDWVPGAEVAGVIEGVRSVLDSAVTKIDAMTAAAMAS